MNKLIYCQERIEHLSDLICKIENYNTNGWKFPVFCTLLLPMYAAGIWLAVNGLVWSRLILATIGLVIMGSIEIIGEDLDCWWTRLPQNHFPFVSDVSPTDGELIVFLEDLTELSFRLTDQDGDLMSYKVKTSPYIGEDKAILVPNGMYTVPIHGLKNSTKYTWDVYLWEGDDSGTSLMHRYTFTTSPIAPVISNPTPKHNAPYVPIFTSNLSFDLTDYQGDLMNWTVETQPDIGSGLGNGVGNGCYNIPINGLEYEKKYTWFVNVTDGTYWTRKTYVFRTTSEGLLVFEPSADTFVYEYHPDNNYGDVHYIRLYNKNRSLGLVLFDLSEIPAGTTIISANLSMFYYEWDLENPTGREISCHRILENWDEMTVTYKTRPAFDRVKCASMILPGNYTWVNWNVTSEVDDFINGGDMNYGWLIRDYKPFSNNNIMHFYYSSNANNNRPPRLFVWYNTP